MSKFIENFLVKPNEWFEDREWLKFVALVVYVLGIGVLFSDPLTATEKTILGISLFAVFLHRVVYFLFMASKAILENSLEALKDEWVDEAREEWEDQQGGRQADQWYAQAEIKWLTWIENHRISVVYDGSQWAVFRNDSRSDSGFISPIEIARADTLRIALDKAKELFPVDEKIE